MSKNNWEKFKKFKRQVKKIAENYEVTQPITNWWPDIDALAKILVEVWRMNKRVIKGEGISEQLTKWVQFSTDKIYAICEENNLKVIDNTWDLYNENMSWLEVVSDESWEDVKWKPFIKDILEPIILLDWKLYKKWKAIISSK